MTQKQFRELHSKGIIRIPRSYFRNDIPSCTDPTQDVPIRNIQLVGDMPINVKNLKGMVMSGVPIDKMTALDRRNNDKFDVLGELQGDLHATSRNISHFKLNQNEK